MGIQGSKSGNSPMTLDEVSRRVTLRPAEVSSLGLVPHSTYAVLSAHAYNDPPQSDLHLPDGWEVLTNCAAIHLDKEGYYAAAYINSAHRHCIIAQRGTSEVLGLRAGVWMYFEEVTIQFYLAAQFSKHVRECLTQLYSGGDQFTVSYTGHSLGAVLAAWRAVEEGTYAITFESPGARAFIEKAGGGPGSRSGGDLDADIITYLRSPNPINTLKPHCGLLVMIPTPPVQLANSTGLLLPPAPDAQPSIRAAASAPQPLVVPSAAAAAAAPSSSPTAAAGGSGVAAADSNAASSPGATHSVSASTSSTPPAAAAAAAAAASPTLPQRSIFSTAATRFRMPSIRPHAYFRGYMLSGVGMGIPELQQYVSKVEPMIRELLERTQQLHSICAIVEYFQKDEGARGDEEKMVVQWPAHLMQFMEYYNTTRALEDPENQAHHVHAAYQSLMQRLYRVEPIQRSRIPVKYVSRRSLALVELWWRLDAPKRKTLPLAPLDHKALNCIKVQDGYLCTTVLTAFQAKQYLSMLASRPAVASILESSYVISAPASKL